MPKKSGLEELIREKYPFPISHAYTYMESRVDTEDRYRALLNCFEVTLKTIASVALSNYIRDIQEDSSLGNASLFQDLLDTLSRPLSLGHWQYLLQLTLRPYARHRERLVMPELFDFYYRLTEQGNVKSQSDHVRPIQRFVEERNEDAHHRSRGVAGTFQRKHRISELTDNLQTLLSGLRFLADYELMYVDHAEHREGQWCYQANVACGTTYPFCQTSWETTLNISSRRCLLMAPDRSAVLDLTPFIIVTSEGRLQQPDIFFFDGVFSSGRANFMSYHVGDYIEPTDESSPASVANDAISGLLNLLRNRIPPTGDNEQGLTEDLLSAPEIYRKAAKWATERGERQTVSLDALRQFLGLSQKEAFRQEQELGIARGVDVEEEIEVPFEGRPSWSNLAYYILDNSGQEEMYYKDIAIEAEALKDQYDDTWQKGNSANVEGTLSAIMSQDPRFYKLRLGYYRLTKNSDLLSNPSWANLACFVLKTCDPKRRGMPLGRITKQAAALKEKHSNWRRQKARTPKNSVSATMSMDHRFESMKKKGYWRLVAGEVEQKDRPAVSEAPATMTRDKAYESVLARLAELGEVQRLPFGRTYFSLDSHIHLMLRFSTTHHRNDEIEYFLGVTPQYFRRILALGNGYLVFVLGAPDNVLLVPAESFAEWVKDVEPCGSGTWPMVFYQSMDRKRLERWVPGGARADVSGFLNDFDGLRRVLSGDHSP